MTVPTHTGQTNTLQTAGHEGIHLLPGLTGRFYSIKNFIVYNKTYVGYWQIVPYSITHAHDTWEALL
jgi:hypothetical protein